MVLKPRFLLWRPQLTLTGRSHYGVNAQGVIISHLDTWDALADNSFLSVRDRQPTVRRIGCMLCCHYVSVGLLFAELVQLFAGLNQLWPASSFPKMVFFPGEAQVFGVYQHRSCLMHHEICDFNAPLQTGANTIFVHRIVTFAIALKPCVFTRRVDTAVDTL